MNAARLLKLYERIAEAPNAIPRLRRFILDLAVRGKLVPHDANDEPASELLKRIEKEKSQLVRSGEIRDAKYLEYSEPSNIAIPDGWRLVALGQIINRHLGGGTPSKNNRDFWDGDIRWASVKDVGKSKYLDDTIDRITKEGLENSSSNLIPAGNLIVVTRMGLGQLSINRVSVAINQDLRALFLSSYLNIDFVYIYLSTFRLDGTGLTVKGIRLEELLSIPFPLPPLAEQHRIVAKVDELMALCDRLEMARAERENARYKLTAATLARLNAPDPETFQNDACFALNALPALTARPDQIKQLRQTILNLAVRGKLVPQDPDDEPISTTLNRALARRAELVREKKVRQKKLDGYDDLVLDSELPSSWVLERLGNLVDPENTISYGVLVPGNDVSDGVPFVRAQDLALSDHPERPNKTISPEIERAYARTRLRGGEILVCVVGSIGKLGIVPNSWAGANIARAVARIAPISEISREYLLTVLRGEPAQSYFSETTRTLAQPTLNVGLIEQTPIPLPPLAEQRRIVAKVEELLALCDQLETSVNDADSTRRRLLDALLAEALEPAAARAFEAAE